MLAFSLGLPHDMFICNHVLQLWGDKPLLYTFIDIH